MFICSAEKFLTPVEFWEKITESVRSHGKEDVVTEVHEHLKEAEDRLLVSINLN